MYVYPQIRRKKFFKENDLEEMRGEGEKDALQKAASWRWGHQYTMEPGLTCTHSSEALLGPVSILQNGEASTLMKIEPFILETSL